MPKPVFYNYTQGYEPKSTAPKYRSSATDHEYYNPDIKEYYSSDSKLIRREETYRGIKYSQTISGSNYAQHWPTYTYSVTYTAWEEVTVS
jgi:hypothetical protein